MKARVKVDVAAMSRTLLGLALAGHMGSTGWYSGSRWYFRRLEELDRLAGVLPAEATIGRMNLTCRLAHAVATLSADTAWGPLWSRFPAWAAAVYAGGELPKLPVYGANVRRAVALLRGEESHASGPKVYAFARALESGGQAPAVIDRHAWRIACSGHPFGERLALTEARLRACQEAHEIAAREFGRLTGQALSAAELQAALWVADVGEHGKAGA